MNQLEQTNRRARSLSLKQFLEVLSYLSKLHKPHHDSHSPFLESLPSFPFPTEHTNPASKKSSKYVYAYPIFKSLLNRIIDMQL